MQGSSEFFHRMSAQRWARYGISLLVIYAVLRAVVAAHARALWFDEIFTWALARQPDVGAIWGALKKGVDTQGLLFDLVQRAVAWIPNIEIGFRLPSIFGFAISVIGVYAFVERRSGGFIGLLSAASLLLTVLFVPVRAVACAIDARGYSLSVACIAIGLVAYQRATKGRWIAALALALALAVGFNYYAVYALVPFVVAEAVYFVESSRIRWAVWIAIAFGALPVAISLPHVLALKRILAGGYFAKPSLSAARDAYGHFLSVSNYWGIAVFVACSVGLLLTLRPAGKEDSGGLFHEFLQWDRLSGMHREELASVHAHEKALVFFLLLTPFTVLIASKVTHGAYFYHYMLYSILGIALAVGFILPALGHRVIFVSSIFLLGALAAQETSFWLSSHAWRFRSPPSEAESALAATGNSDLPVVIETPHDYLPMAFYASPELGRRIVFIADGPSALGYGGFDTDDVELELLSQYLPLNITDFESFRASHKSFLMYAAMPNPHDWWLRRLTAEGFTVQFKAFEPLLSDQAGVVFLVTAP
jgi:hypothetical protein